MGKHATSAHWGATWITSCALFALAGCHAPIAAPVHPAPAAPQLPVTTRSAIEPDTSAVPTDPTTPATRPKEYLRLTADECRSFAIAHAPFADDLDRHEENDSPSHPKLKKKNAKFAEASRWVRGHAADELRNRAAADALEEFFKLIDAEGQFDLLAAADAELRGQLAEALKAEKAGLKDRADIPAIRRRLLDIEAKQAKLVGGIGALNASLRARIGLAASEPLPLWPTDPLKVKAEELDVEQAVATGLRYRPDLNVLRVLAHGGAGELTNALLTGINPLLATLKSDNPLAILFAPFTKEPERQQAAATARAAAALAARERLAEAEIRAAAVVLHGHRASVAARVLDVRQVEANITELQKRQKAGINVTADLTTAKLELITAKSELLKSAIEWHIAEVKLRQAMGLLVRSDGSLSSP